ncbi:MAG TPA: nickel-dependent lactate racemase [bacterium]
MPSIFLPFGATAFQLPVEADLLAPPETPALDDEAGAILQALDHPTACEPLASLVKPGETVVIIVNDITRLARSDMFLPPIVDTLNRGGVPDGDISIVFALGTHRAQTEAEMRAIVGAGIARRIRMYDHDGDDDANLVDVGTTSFGNRVEINRRVFEADRIILTGEIIFHQIAGYSGGRKSLLPGVAGNRTTTFNHRMVLDPRCGAGILDGNPAHEDMLEGSRMVGPDFVVNVVLSPAGKLLYVAAGDVEQAHLEGCRAADRLLRTYIDRPYDMVIASAGGAPLDIDLRQAHKGMENACAALRPGGTLYYYAECADGLGSAKLEHYLETYTSEVEMESALEQNFVVGGHKALWLARIGKRYDAHLVTNLDARIVKQCGFQAVLREEHKIRLFELIQQITPGRIAVMPHAGFTRPALRDIGRKTND